MRSVVAKGGSPPRVEKPAHRNKTSSGNQGRADNRALGQCAVTALVVQDVLRGELLRAEVNGTSHYWNRLPDGTELDLTREQFETFLPSGIETRSREYVLSFDETRMRYELLKKRAFANLPIEATIATQD